MQPDPPQPGFPQHGQPPMSGGPAPWGGGPSPLAAPKPRAHAAAAAIASVLALLIAGMLVWFALYNVVYAYQQVGHLTSMMVVNVLGGAIGAGALLVAAGFTFTRRIPGAWTLCALCALYVVANFVASPLLWGVPFGDQLKWIFSFDDSDSGAVALSTIFSVLAAITAAIAASAKSYAPTTTTPPGR